MNFYQSIKNFSEYLVSIRKLEDYFSFDLKIPIKWTIPKNISEGKEVLPFESGDDVSKGFSFVCEDNEKSVEELISIVKKIIQINKERELKEKLFRETIDRLKQTFEKTDLDKLKKLYFDFENEEENLIEDEQDGQISNDAELV